jgi:hypothetical protein
MSRDESKYGNVFLTHKLFVRSNLSGTSSLSTVAISRSRLWAENWIPFLAYLMGQKSQAAMAQLSISSRKAVYSLSLMTVP